MRRQSALLYCSKSAIFRARVVGWRNAFMFGLGAPELIVILVVALLIFGPGKLPEIGSALGKGIRDFRKALENKGEEQANAVEKAPADKPET